MTNMMIEVSDQTMQANRKKKKKKSVVITTNMSYVYLLACVWVFCFLKVQKFNLSPTLAINYTKSTLLSRNQKVEKSLVFFSDQLICERRSLF